jgi:putative transposase
MQKIIQRRGEQAWRELVERQAQSGLSVPAFCQREGISAWSLYGWRSRLRARRTGAVPVVSRSAAEEPAPGFIDLGALGPSRSRCEVRLDLGGGVVVHVVRS